MCAVNVLLPSICRACVLTFSDALWQSSGHRRGLELVSNHVSLTALVSKEAEACNQQMACTFHQGHDKRAHMPSSILARTNAHTCARHMQDERSAFEQWLTKACHRPDGLVHISWAQPYLPTSARCYLMAQLEAKLLEARRSKPTRACHAHACSHADIDALVDSTCSSGKRACFTAQDVTWPVASKLLYLQPRFQCLLRNVAGDVIFAQATGALT